MRALCTLRLQSASAVLNSGRKFASLSHFTGPRIAQELQNASAVLKCEEYVAPLSHFTDPGAPECERSAQSAHPMCIRRVEFIIMKLQEGLNTLRDHRPPEV